MTYDAATLKKIIQTFVDESTGENIHLQGKGGEMILANRSIFEIESFLVSLRKRYGINNRLDTSIVSENILSQFTTIEASSAYSASDFQYNFLYHLARKYKVDVSLYSLIDSFIEKFKPQFRLADIALTNTGATRCKTNIRFSINTLRDFGLVISREGDEKRSWSPSVLGLVALLNIEFCKPEPTGKFYRSPELLIKSVINPVLNVGPLDPLLWYSLNEFRKPDHLYVYLTTQSDYALNKEEKNLLQQILNEFIEFTHTGLEIKSNGIKLTKVFKEKSEQFQEKLFEMQQNSTTLQDKLFAHFRKAEGRK